MLVDSFGIVEINLEYSLFLNQVDCLFLLSILEITISFIDSSFTLNFVLKSHWKRSKG